MNAKKLSLTLSAVVLGLTSCGGAKTLTRQEAYAKLDEIVKATPATQTKLTSVNNTMEDVKDSSGNVTSKAGTLTTYVFDAEKNYAHVTLGEGRKLSYASDGEAKEIPFGAGDELYAYVSGTDYVFGVKATATSTDENSSVTTTQTSWKFTITSSDTVLYPLAKSAMDNFAAKQINAFVVCGREHWHNGAGGLSAYLKRQDTLDQNKQQIVVGSETIEAGATEKGSYIALADEKYTSTGDGNLVLDFDALYPNPDTPAKLHEPLKFEFNNNLLTHWYNKKASSYAGNEWTMNYGTADAKDCAFEEKTTVADKAASIAIPALIAALVAIDQPTDSSVLYPAKWGTK